MLRRGSDAVGGSAVQWKRALMAALQPRATSDGAAIYYSSAQLTLSAATKTHEAGSARDGRCV